MTKNEFLTIIKKEIPDLDDFDWDIEIDSLTKAGFVLGCYYNEKNKIWNIYETTERGDEDVIFTAKSEEEAYDKLYKLVMFHKRLNDEYNDDDDYDEEEVNEENK